MNKVANIRGPLGLKLPKPKPNPEHLAKVRQLPCAICHHHYAVMVTGGHIQAHHCISGRYSQAKAPDKMAIPLCEGHHQGLWDTSKPAIHKDKKTWERKYGADTDYVPWTLDMIERASLCLTKPRKLKP